MCARELSTDVPACRCARPYPQVTNEVRKFRQEQERKVIAKAAQAASQAALARASSRT